MADGRKPDARVFAIEQNGGQDKSYWHEIGAAWRNKDGSYNVKLHMFPLLRLQLREQGEPEK
jgi:hypothetical protein